ncbi:cdc42 effector protein 1 [Mus caroli]|uniref:Cdc42 effector protein 1 n=1 Tax=Mus caroli TaxID=10089 RepID=A0A6P5R5V6_MUSCR|nr:cdc42 effector protein 1 [Mus caroli]XP_029325951.1 cdc42 effector protein 1 [Mus caroli]
MPGPQGGTGAPTMSLGKLSPVGWVSSSHGKRRLTADMISPPLGDFRHTMHVGRGGDVFGDTSFLSNHGGRSGNTHRSPRSFLARKLQQVRRVGVPPRRTASPAAPSPAPPPISPIIKNAISLPQLNQATYDSLVVGKLSFDSTPASSMDGHSGYGLESGFCTISRLPRVEKHSNRDRDRDHDPDHSQDREQSPFPSEPTPNPELRRSDSLLSFRFDLDLGPSLLSELLGVMSLSEAPAAETPVPTANPPAPAANPTPTAKPPAHVITTLDAVTSLPASAVTSLPASAAASSPSHGHFPNGVTSVLGPAAEVKPRPVGEGPQVPSNMAFDRRGTSWGASRASWGASRASRHYTEMDARRELAGVLPQVHGSWESLNEDWSTPPASVRAPVPSSVQVNAFEFADAEEDDEVKV